MLALPRTSIFFRDIFRRARHAGRFANRGDGGSGRREIALREFEDRAGKTHQRCIERARFRRPVVPGDTLTLERRAANRKQSAENGVARVDEQITASRNYVHHRRPRKFEEK